MGGGYTVTQIVSTWTGTVRWARNQISIAEETRENLIGVTRNIRGASARVFTNRTSDATLVAAAHQAESLVARKQENPESDLVTRLPLEPHDTPHVFSVATYQLDEEHRTAAAIALAQRSATAGMLSAGDIKVWARSLAMIDSFGRARYFPYTQAQYSVTVRDPSGTASGWAGLDHFDWVKIDADRLTAIALNKCLRSRNPVRVEPGRYTTILEPQATGDLVGCLLSSPTIVADAMSLDANLYPSSRGIGPFNKTLSPIRSTRWVSGSLTSALPLALIPWTPTWDFLHSDWRQRIASKIRFAFQFITRRSGSSVVCSRT
jgi:predicted Zn-dependent protease